MSLLLDYYFRIVPLHLKGIPSNSRVIIPQAFGRNTHSDNELWSNIKPLFSFASDEERFAELKRQGFDPGLPNRILARRCAFLAQQFQLQIQIIGQWEVLYVLFQDYSFIYQMTKAQAIWPQGDGYLGTMAVLHATKRMLGTLPSNPIVVAQSYHLERCIRLAKKIFPDEAVGWYSDIPIEGNEFDPNSVQPWTRDRKSFVQRERLVRLHHLLKRWT